MLVFGKLVLIPYKLTLFNNYCFQLNLLSSLSALEFQLQRQDMENITIEIDEVDQTIGNYSTVGIPNSPSDRLLDIILNVSHVIISGLTIFFNLSIFLVILSRQKLRTWNNFYLCGMFLAAILGKTL